MYSIEDISKSIFKTSGVAMSSYQLEIDLLEIFVESEMDIQLLLQADKLFTYLHDNKNNILNPIFLLNEINLGFVVFYSNKYHKYFLIGPFKLSKLKKEFVMDYYLNKITNQELVKSILSIFEHIPILDLKSIVNVTQFYFHLIEGKNIDDSVFEHKSVMSIHYSEDENYSKQQRNFHTSIETEKYLIDCIRNGDVARLANRNMKALNDLTTLGNDEIRSLKNNMISSISVVTRVAIEEGIAVEIAFPLSDFYIIQLENRKEATSIIDIYKQCLIDFTTRIKNNKFGMKYSQVINRCCGYILLHYNKPLKLTDVASEVQLHPDYLSRLFKKETGISVIEYIRKVKIEEAKLLIKHSNTQLTNVAFQLGYSNQSIFIKDFKRVTGLLPSEYRK